MGTVMDYSTMQIGLQRKMHGNCDRDFNIVEMSGLFNRFGINERKA